MLNGDEILTLLGRSESDADVRALLAALEIEGPLPRPKRSEVDIRLPLEKQGIELGFAFAESLPEKFASQFDEGELVFNVVFFTPTEAAGAAQELFLPKGLHQSMSRAQARDKLGAPEWSSPVMNSDRWKYGDIQIVVRFSDDESSITRVSSQLVK